MNEACAPLVTTSGPSPAVATETMLLADGLPPDAKLDAIISEYPFLFRIEHPCSMSTFLSDGDLVSGFFREGDSEVSNIEIPKASAVDIEQIKLHICAWQNKSKEPSRWISTSFSLPWIIWHRQRLFCLQNNLKSAAKSGHFVIIDTRILKSLARPNLPLVLLATEILREHDITDGAAFNYSKSAQEVLFYGYIPNEAIVFQTTCDIIDAVLVPLYPPWPGKCAFAIYAQGFEVCAYAEGAVDQVSEFLASCRSSGSLSKPHDMRSLEGSTAFISSALWSLFETKLVRKAVREKWPRCPYLAPSHPSFKFLALHATVLNVQKAHCVNDLVRLLIGKFAAAMTITEEADQILGGGGTSSDGDN